MNTEIDILQDRSGALINPKALYVNNSTQTYLVIYLFGYLIIELW